MDRRAFLKASAILPAAASLPRLSFAQSAFDPRPTDKWRSFEVATRVEIVFPQGATRVWLPIPSVESAYQKTIGQRLVGQRPKPQRSSTTASTARACSTPSGPPPSRIP